MKVLIGGLVPVKVWTNDVEDGAMEQITNLANLPFVFRHVAIMPDVHRGYGMPIGGVLATVGVVIPNAVGVDIGCGMIASRTNLTEIDVETLKKVMGKIRELVPVGFKHHKEKQDERMMPMGRMTDVCQGQYQEALYQIGTLGGGNHFIEIQKGSDGYVWVMIHSGSRNIGYRMARYYNELAVKMNERWHTAVPKEWELAFLPLDSDEGNRYMTDMEYCVQFAYQNRKLMMDRVEEAFKDVIVGSEFGMLYSSTHNYAAMEEHFGRNVIVHRKGATPARDGQYAIIPGSQGTKSYIVLGLGNRESFKSCSHGAGRRMGRKQACKDLDLAAEIKKLDDQGIVHGIRTSNDLDEAAGAYKDITTVMENQRDLVSPVVELSPLGVIKG